MTQITAGASSPLIPEARQLSGEIVRTLNMNQHAPDEVRADFGSKSAVPACHEFSHNRAEILGLSRRVPSAHFARGDNASAPTPTTHPRSASAASSAVRSAATTVERHAASRQRQSRQGAEGLWREMESLARF